MDKKNRAALFVVAFIVFLAIIFMVNAFVKKSKQGVWAPLNFKEAGSNTVIQETQKTQEADMPVADEEKQEPPVFAGEPLLN